MKPVAQVSHVKVEPKIPRGCSILLGHVDHAIIEIIATISGQAPISRLHHDPADRMQSAWLHS